MPFDAMGEDGSNPVTVSADGFTVDATLVAKALRLRPDIFWRMLQRGVVHSFAERGEGDDLGRTRLTFRFRSRTFRLTLQDAAR
jgi:hypothetical protein